MEKELRKAIELEPENASYHYMMGFILHEMGKYEEAAMEKRKSIELEPENPEFQQPY